MARNFKFRYYTHESYPIEGQKVKYFTYGRNTICFTGTVSIVCPNYIIIFSNGRTFNVKIGK
jgi:hypothetical protein